MSLFSIDRAKCVKCGACVAECPTSLVRMPEADSFPEPLAGKEQGCIACGHCQAVCPTGALTLGAFDPTEFVPIREELGVSPEQVEQLFKSRRSVRSFTPEPVDRETLAGLVDFARWSPTGHNLQAVRWAVVESREGVVRLTEQVVDWMRSEAEKGSELSAVLNMPGLVRAWDKGKDVICRGAPHLVAAWTAPGEGVTPDLDAVAALTQVELAAHALGLGACWDGYLIFTARHTDVCHMFGIPEGSRVHGVLMLGRPRLRYRQIPPRKEADVRWV